MRVDTVVFDIGGVLVDWQPHLAWADDLGEDGARAFLDRIGFDKINFACDGGARFSHAADKLPDPKDAAHLRQYVERYTRTVPEKISGTWDILHALRNQGIALHAITNWSAETWPEGLKVHPELGQVFGTTVVSGQIGIVKPSVAIYRQLCAEAGVRPAQCVFIDDGPQNCIGAQAAGMDAIHFTSPEALGTQLKVRGLLS